MVGEHTGILTGENPGDVTQCLACNNQLEAELTQRGQNGTTKISLGISLLVSKKNSINLNLKMNLVQMISKGSNVA